MKKIVSVILILFTVNIMGLPHSETASEKLLFRKLKGSINTDKMIREKKDKLHELALSEPLKTYKKNNSEIPSDKLAMEDYTDFQELKSAKSTKREEIMETAPNSSIAAAFNIRKRKKNSTSYKFGERRFYRNPYRRLQYYYPRHYTSYYPALYGYKTSCQY